MDISRIQEYALPQNHLSITFRQPIGSMAVGRAHGGSSGLSDMTRHTTRLYICPSLLEVKCLFVAETQRVNWLLSNKTVNCLSCTVSTWRDMLKPRGQIFMFSVPDSLIIN